MFSTNCHSNSQVHRYTALKLMSLTQNTMYMKTAFPLASIKFLKYTQSLLGWSEPYW